MITPQSPSSLHFPALPFSNLLSPFRELLSLPIRPAMKSAVLSVLGALLFLPAAFANPVEEMRDGLDRLWPGFKAAWNEKSIPGLLPLHHPDSPLRLDYAKHRKQVTAELKALFDKVGEIEAYHIESFVNFRDRFIVRIKYAKDGWILGTFSLSKDKGKHWKLMVFDAHGGSDLLDEIENLQKAA